MSTSKALLWIVVSIALGGCVICAGGFGLCGIPEELIKDGSPTLTAAKEAGKEVVDSAKEKVLEKFKDVLGGK